MVSFLTAYTDMDPSPRVTVDIDDTELDGSTDAITLWQLSAEVEVAVRSAVEVASAGGVIVTDYEVPLGVTVTYRVEQFASGVSIGFADITLVTQVDVATDVAIVQDPLVPQSAVAARAELGFADSLTRRRPTRVYQTGSRSVALMGLRGLLEDVSLRCYTSDLTERDALDEILAETQVLVRTMPNFPIPRVLHAVIPDVIRDPVDYHVGGSMDVWDLTGQEVSRSDIEVLVPVINYQLFADAYATYADAAAAFSTYIDALRNPPSPA